MPRPPPSCKSADTALATISWDIAAAMLRLPDWMWYPGKFTPPQGGADAARLPSRRSWRAGARPASRATTCWRAWHARRTPRPARRCRKSSSIDNLVTFLAAGHETTAKALTWTLYLLARAPQWQERILAEVDAVVGSDAIERRAPRAASRSRARC